MSEDCLFCRIRDGQIPSPRIYEDDVCFVVSDISPQAPFHFLVLPKKHIPSLDKLQPGDEAIVGHLFAVAAQVARDKGFAEDGYRVAVNCNRHGCQTVFHLHVHLIGGRQMGEPPG